MRIVLLCVMTMLLGTAAFALPLYSAREGRSCSNCHVNPMRDNPDGWANPELPERKCSLSCMVCHVDPSGGGLRNTAGRYYGRSTLGVVGFEERPTEDRDRDILAFVKGMGGLLGRNTERPKPAEDVIEIPNATPSEAPVTVDGSADAGTPEGTASAKTEPDSSSDAPRPVPIDSKQLEADYRAALPEGVGSGYQHLVVPADFARVHRNAVKGPVWGKPSGEISENSLWDGRYGDLNADPLVSVGTDVRLAYWSAGDKIFPMQADLHNGVHPTEHLTLVSTLGLQGHKRGKTSQDYGTSLRFRNLFIMTHEWPYMSYAKVGRFANPYGIKLDDHTSAIRRQLDLDLGQPESLVNGIEVGAAPNYPYVHMAMYENVRKASDKLDFGVDNKADPGYGATLSTGYREVGWQLGTSLMTKQRVVAAGGDYYAGGISGAYNPWYYDRKLPVTFLGEFDVTSRDRASHATQATGIFTYAEANYLPFNGTGVRLKHDFADPDTELTGDAIHKATLSFDLIPVTGFTLTLQMRRLMPEAGISQSDALLLMHAWL